MTGPFQQGTQTLGFPEQRPEEEHGLAVGMPP